MNVPARIPTPLWASLLVASASGLALAAAFPDLGWWPLAFVGTAGMLWSLADRTLGQAALVGVVGGASFWLPLIDWLTVYLGPIPWLALSGAMIVYVILGFMLLALAWRWVPRMWTGRWTTLVALPAVLAGLWTLREAVSSTVPYGGFSWGRLAFSQSESPFGSLAAWVGASGLSFLIAYVAALIAVAIRIRGVGVVARGIAVTGVAAGLLAVPAFPVVASGELRVAAVQGDSDAGLFAQYRPGEIFADHLEVTRALYGEDVDVVVWPENSSDLNPLWHPPVARGLDEVSRELDAPVVTGTITQDSEQRIFNSMLLWHAGDGAVDQYDKIHPVPFAEYLPDRDFWYPLAPALFDLVPRDYSFGQRDNVFEVAGAVAGIAICFDIVDDALIRQMLDSGADIIFAPTNNADFGHTDESAQQLAIARLRAIETNRTVVNISTVGTSAIIAPDGSTIDELETFTPGAMIETVPLSEVTTFATVLGRLPELLVGGFALAALVAAGALARRRSRS